MLVVTLDFDGVMYPFHRAISSWASAAGRPALPTEPDCWAYWRQAGLDDDEWEALLSAFGEDGGYRAEAPDPDALEGIGALFDAGCDLVGATSRPPSRAVVASTYGWVGDWCLPLRSVLIGPAAKLEVECDLLIDDDPAALVALADLGEAAGLLLDRPWNQDAPGPRVSWEDLPGCVSALADLVAGVDETERKWAVADALESFFGEEFPTDATV